MTSIIKLIVALSLLATLLVTSVLVTPAVQARALHNVDADGGGRRPAISPDFGGDDDQPTVIQHPARKRGAANAASDFGSSAGFVGNTSFFKTDDSFFTSVESVVVKRLRALWALLLSPDR
jgi:hypothetical protein